MTLLFMDGFDVGDFDLKWFVSTHDGVAPVTSSTTPYFEGLSLKISTDSSGLFGEVFTNLKRALTPAATFIGGWQFRWLGTNTANTALLSLYTDSGASIHLQLILRADGTLALYRRNGPLTSFGGSATLLAAGPASSIHPGGWYFIEVKATIDALAGICVVRVNEKEVINFTGQTQNGGSSTLIDAMALNQTVSPPDGFVVPELYYDDLYACDALGTVNNDFLGIGRVQTLLPDGAGASTMLVPTGSGSNFDNVNDVPYSTADYNASATVGDRDLYTLDDLAAATASVAGVQTVLIAEADDATAHIKAALRSAGTVYYDATVALDASAADASIVVRETNPATGTAWTASSVNALQAGVEIA